MSGNLRQIFEYELHRKLSLRAKTTTSEMNLLISSFKFYDIDETGFITRENWPKVFGRIGLSGFSEYDFNELFDMFDPNKTGIINYKNFTQYMYDLGPYLPFQENSNVNNMSNNINMNNLNMKNNIFIHNNNKVQSFNNSFNQKGQSIQNNIQNNIQDNIQNPVPQIQNDNQRYKPITPLNSNQNIPNYHNMNNNMNNNINNNMNINMNDNMNDNMNYNMNNNMNMNLQNPMMNQPNQIPMQNNFPSENDSEGMKRYFQNLLQLFQSKININNGITFYNLLSKINNRQDKMSKTISYENFLSSIKEANIDINEMDIKDFFILLDLSEQNKVSTDEILRLIRGYLSERRKMIIVEKFAKIDSEKKGFCEINLIKSFYNPNQHPDVLMGKKRESEIYEEFIYTFDTYTTYKEKLNTITFDDFIEYYSGISASIYNEDYFVDMMNGVWDTPINYHNIERSNNNVNIGNNINIQQEQSNFNNQIRKPTPIENQQFNNNMNNNNFDIQFQSRRPQSFNPLTKNEPKYNIISGEFNDNNNNINNQYNQDLNYNQNTQFSQTTKLTNEYNQNTQFLSQNQNQNPQSQNTQLQNQNNQSIETLNKLRSMIISRGPKSLFVIEKMLSMYDNTHTGKIDFPTFEKIITLYRLSLTPNEIVTIFSLFDNTNSGKINYDDLIKGIIDTLPLRREQLIRKIFNTISNGRNEISFQELKSNYNASRDPEVVARKKIPEEVIGEFSDNLEIFREYNSKMSKSNNGYFCYDDFLKFYSQISLGISDNNYFEYLVNNVWNLDGGNANNYYNYGNNVFEQRARSAYNRF